jgi:hypothetical protein
LLNALSAFAKGTARHFSRSENGGKGIRTPDFQLAKLALYQLSYAPAGNFEFRLPIFECKGIKANAGWRSNESTSGTRCFACLF